MSKCKVNTLETVDGTKSILVKDIANMFTEYVDNAAAITGGLSVGNFYYNTTDAKNNKGSLR